MHRRGAPWLLAVPLIAAGSMAAHVLGSRLVSAPVAETGGEASETHVAVSVARSSSAAPMLLGVLAALLVVALIRRARRTPASARWFVLLPPVAYAIQEAIERLMHAETSPFNPVHEPAFLLALLLQVPFGLVAFLTARALLRVADALARMLSREVTAPERRAVGTSAPARAPRLRPALLAGGHSPRSPPLPSF